MSATKVCIFILISSLFLVLSLELTASADNRAWIQLSPVSAPSARYDHAAAQIDGTTKVLLFGGSGSGGSDTWIFDAADNSWKEKSPSISRPRSLRPVMAAVLGTHKVVSFGGDAANSNETWIYDADADVWAKINVPVSPARVQNHAMAPISGTHKVLMFGGQFINLTASSSTWIFDADTNTWAEVMPLTVPPRTYNHAMAQISGTHKVLMFGGDGDAKSTWIFDADAKEWIKLAPAIVPPSRRSHAIAAVDSDKRVILFGGSYAGGAIYGDTWVFDGVDNTWAQLNLVSPPSARRDHTLTTISGSSKLLLFGGSTGAATAVLNGESWLLELSSPPVCGNNIAESPEYCDGTDLAGKDCTNYAAGSTFTGGTLACKADCTAFDTSACTAPPVCTNAEVCDSVDNDCNGVIDDSIRGIANSACSAAGLFEYTWYEVTVARADNELTKRWIFDLDLGLLTKQDDMLNGKNYLMFNGPRVSGKNHIKSATYPYVAGGALITIPANADADCSAISDVEYEIGVDASNIDNVDIGDNDILCVKRSDNVYVKFSHDRIDLNAGKLITNFAGYASRLCTDADSDGYGISTDLSACTGSITITDCNDMDASAFPGNTNLICIVDSTSDANCNSQPDYLEEACGTCTEGTIFNNILKRCEPSPPTGGGGGGAPGTQCGNNIVDTGEDCDGTALGEKTCADFAAGYTGSVSCTAMCKADFGKCELVSSATEFGVSLAAGQSVSGSADGLFIRYVVKAKNNIAEPSVKFITYATAPENVPAINDTFSYARAEPSFSDADVESVTLTFIVAKKWLDDNNFDKSKVKLNRYETDKWVPYAATIEEEQSEAIIYTVVLPGLSDFAVTSEKVEEAVAPPPAPSQPQTSGGGSGGSGSGGGGGGSSPAIIKQVVAPVPAQPKPSIAAPVAAQAEPAKSTQAPVVQKATKSRFQNSNNAFTILLAAVAALSGFAALVLRARHSAGIAVIAKKHGVGKPGKLENAKNFIAHALSEEHSVLDIKDNLLKSGWKKGDVERAATESAQDLSDLGSLADSHGVSEPDAAAVRKLKAYVKAGVANGYTKAQIRAVVLADKWPKSIVDKAIKEA